MSKELYNKASECVLRPAVKAVLQQLAWFGSDSGENIWPSVPTIAWRTGLRRRTVQKILRELESQQVISASGSRLGGRGHSTHYRIELTTLSRLRESAAHVRPLFPQKGESQDRQTANVTPVKGEPRSPENKGNEKEQERRTSAPYELQRLRARVTKIAKDKAIPAMTKDQSRDRRAVLERQQAELLAPTCRKSTSES